LKLPERATGIVKSLCFSGIGKDQVGGGRPAMRMFSVSASKGVPETAITLAMTENEDELRGLVLTYKLMLDFYECYIHRLLSPTTRITKPFTMDRLEGCSQR